MESAPAPAAPAQPPKPAKDNKAPLPAEMAPASAPAWRMPKPHPHGIPEPASVWGDAQGVQVTLHVCTADASAVQLAQERSRLTALAEAERIARDSPEFQRWEAFGRQVEELRRQQAQEQLVIDQAALDRRKVELEAPAGSGRRLVEVDQIAAQARNDLGRLGSERAKLEPLLADARTALAAVARTAWRKVVTALHAEIAAQVEAARAALDAALARHLGETLDEFSIAQMAKNLSAGLLNGDESAAILVRLGGGLAGPPHPLPAVSDDEL